jgi:hypothetical protein
MARFGNRRWQKPRPPAPDPQPEPEEFTDPHRPGSTGLEASELRALVDTRATVTVVLKTGDQLRGRVRYYDRDCFSLGPAGGGPKIFLRKSSVLYILQE